MDKIAYYWGGHTIYWSSILLTLAAGVAICFFLSRYLKQEDPLAAGFLAVPMSIALSLLFARLLHWYCRTDSYDSLWKALTEPNVGGYALLGVFAGCLLAALLLRVTKATRNLPRMLDCMAYAAAAGIAVGRLSAFFNTTDRGQILTVLQFLPFAYPVTNTVSGAQEYRLATFLFQALVSLGIFLWLNRYDRRRHRDGDLTLRFLLVYGASQVVLDSTRYDKLFFRSNGFISIVQVAGAVALVIAVVFAAVRMARSRGFRLWYIPAWLGILALLGGAGFMEYYVQRHGDLALFSYSVMTLCLSAVVGVTLAMAHSAENADRR